MFTLFLYCIPLKRNTKKISYSECILSLLRRDSAALSLFYQSFISSSPLRCRFVLWPSLVITHYILCAVSSHHSAIILASVRTLSPFYFFFFPSRCFRLIINRILDEGILLVCQSNCNLQSIINIRYFRILKNSMLVRVYIESDK